MVADLLFYLKLSSSNASGAALVEGNPDEERIDA